MDPKENTNTNPDTNSEPETNEVPVNIGKSDTPDTSSDATDDQPVGAVNLGDMSSEETKAPGIPAVDDTPAAMPEMPDLNAADINAAADDDSASSPQMTIDSTEDNTDPTAPKIVDIKPADPVPGSIGSATSGPAKTESTPEVTPEDTPEATPEVTSETTPDLTATTPAFDPGPNPGEKSSIDALTGANQMPATDMDATPQITVQKKSRSSTIVLLIILALVLIGAAVIGIVFLMQPKNTSTSTTQVTPKTTVRTQLACSADITANQTLANKAQNIKTFDYTDSELTSAMDLTKYTFVDADTAKTKTAEIEAAYKALYTDTGLTSDPFTSEFTNKETIVSATHNITKDQLTVKNVAIIGLKASESGDLDLSQAKIKSTLEASGYICASADASTSSN